MSATAEVYDVNLESDTIAALLADAKAQGTDLASLVGNILTQKYATRSNRETMAKEPDDFWDAMTEEEKQEEIRAVEEGIADCEAGRVLTMEQVMENAKAKFGIDLPRFSASV